MTIESFPKSKQLSRNVKLLGVVSLFNDIASEMTYPLLPQFLISVLGGNKFQLGIIEGFADSVASLLKLWSGALSDRIGQRKRLVVVGYGMAIVARPLIGFVVAPWQMFVARICDRVGKGIRTSPRDALIAESTPADMHGRAFGFHRAMDHLGAAIGPVLAMLFLFVWPEQLRALFLITFLPEIGVMVLLVGGLREQPVEQSQANRFSLTLKPFDRRFRVFLLAIFIFTLGNASDAFLLVRAKELGVPTALLPLLWAAFHVVKSIGNLIAGRAADTCGSRPLILMGWTIYAAIQLAFALAQTAWQMWITFLLYGLFYAVTEPAEKKFVAELVGPENKGLAFGWFNFAIGIAALPASVLFGWFYEQFGPLMAFGWGAMLATVAALLLGTFSGYRWWRAWNL